jgi:hypothetical protein
MARLSYRQLNKEADECGYASFEHRLLVHVLSDRHSDVEFLLDMASHHALKKVLVDLITTLGESKSIYSPTQIQKIVALATKIVEQRLLNIKEE